MQVPSITGAYEQLMRAALMAAGARSRRVSFGFKERVHLLDWPGFGDLPAVVLVHGFSASGPSQYLPLARRLRPHVRRILLPDLPGHGGSSLPESGLDGDVLVEALRAAMDAALDEPAVMFATSLGGGVAVQFALSRPNALCGLALCSPGGAPFAPDEIGPFSRIFSLDDHEGALAFIDRLLPASADDRARTSSLWYSPPLRHATAWAVRQQFNRPHLRQLLSRLPQLRLLDPDDLRDLRVPIYLIWGGSDEILPPSHFEFYRAHLPVESQIDTPAHFGHAPFLHHVDELAARLLSFLRRVAAAQPIV